MGGVTEEGKNDWHHLYSMIALFKRFIISTIIIIVCRLNLDGHSCIDEIIVHASLHTVMPTLNSTLLR